VLKHRKYTHSHNEGQDFLNLAKVGSSISEH